MKAKIKWPYKFEVDVLWKPKTQFKAVYGFSPKCTRYVFSVLLYKDRKRYLAKNPPYTNGSYDPRTRTISLPYDKQSCYYDIIVHEAVHAAIDIFREERFQLYQLEESIADATGQLVGGILTKLGDVDVLLGKKN